MLFITPFKNSVYAFSRASSTIPIICRLVSPSSFCVRNTAYCHPRHYFLHSCIGIWVNKWIDGWINEIKWTSHICQHLNNNLSELLRKKIIWGFRIISIVYWWHNILITPMYFCKLSLIYKKKKRHIVTSVLRLDNHILHVFAGHLATCFLTYGCQT